MEKFLTATYKFRDLLAINYTCPVEIEENVGAIKAEIKETYHSLNLSAKAEALQKAVLIMTNPSRSKEFNEILRSHK